MHLYHQVRSSSTRVLWMLEEIGAPYDLTVIAREDKQTDWYRGLQPLGKAPVAVDDEGPLFESVALCLHLADLHPEAGLIETPGSHARGLQYQWALFAVAELQEAMMTAARELWSEGEPSPAIVDPAIERFQRACAVVEAAIADDGWLVGGRFSVADLTVGALLIFAGMNDLGTQTPAIAAYVERLDARPARQRAIGVSG